MKVLAREQREWEEDEDGVVTWEGRLYVPKDSRLRGDIIRAHHDAPAAGHPGWYKTQELITRSYWWPGIQCDIRDYISGCNTCQQAKPHQSHPNAPLNPNKVPTELWAVVSVDLIGELPES